MEKESYSIKGVAHSKIGIERFMKGVFITAATFGIAAVFAITIYMFINGTPAFAKIGIKDLLFGTIWEPTNNTNPQFGIFYVIITSIIGTFAAVLIGVPIGLFAAIFLAEVAPKPLVKIVQPAVELLAAIPSVIYGLLGLVILNPLMYKWELAVCCHCISNYDSSNRYQCKSIVHPIRTKRFKSFFLCIRSFPYTNYFQSITSSSKFWNYKWGCFGNWTCHGRSHGNYTCVWELGKYSSSI